MVTSRGHFKRVSCAGPGAPGRCRRVSWLTGNAWPARCRELVFVCVEGPVFRYRAVEIYGAMPSLQARRFSALLVGAGLLATVAADDSCCRRRTGVSAVDRARATANRCRRQKNNPNEKKNHTTGSQKPLGSVRAVADDTWRRRQNRLLLSRSTPVELEPRGLDAAALDAVRARGFHTDAQTRAQKNRGASSVETLWCLEDASVASGAPR